MMRDIARRRFAAASCTFLLALIVLVPTSLSVSLHQDESQYLWMAGYFGGKAAQLDFRLHGTDAFRDPGWDPFGFWAITQPMGTRAVYAVAMRLGQASPPARPFSYDLAVNGPETQPAPYTLFVGRLAGLVCAALGFGLVSLRLGWRGLAVAGAMLALPPAQADFARAWAEGPLMLGFGLATLAYGTRWFGIAAGFAATFKLTALGLWPLIFLSRGHGRSPLRQLLCACSAAATWTLLTPTAWFAAGPAYLIPMVVNRGARYTNQAVTFESGPLGIWLPNRYLWPFELAVCIGLVVLVPRLWQRLGLVTPRKADPNLRIRSRVTKAA